MPAHVEIAEAKTEDRWEIIGNRLSNVLVGNLGRDTMAGGAQDDTLRGKRGDDVLLGDTGNDILTGDAGNDTLESGAGDDTIDGGAGIDLLRLTAEGGARFDLGKSGPQRTGDGRDTVFDIEGVLGGPGNDTLLGSVGDDVIGGGAGDDRIVGRRGDDTLRLSAGNDTLEGGGGFDLLIYEGAGDLLINLGRERATLPDGSSQLSGIEMVEAGPGDDRLQGSPGADNLRGGSGNDLLSGSDGADNLSGGAGNDTLKGGRGADTLDGGSGSNLVTGNAGRDLLSGGARSTLAGGDGNDRLEGGKTQLGGRGADVLVNGVVMSGEGGDDRIFMDASNESASGGPGSDTFIVTERGFSETIGGDATVGRAYIIEDFSAEDVLDTSVLDPFPDTPGDDAFSFERNPETGTIIIGPGSGIRFDLFFPVGGGNATLIEVDNELVVGLDTDEDRIGDTFIVFRNYDDPVSWLL